MPVITLGYCPISTRALAAVDHTNFTTTIANQGLYTQGGTPVVTDFVLYSGELPENATISGVSCRINYTGTPGTKSTISCFAVDMVSGTITAIQAALLDTGTGNHDVSVTFTTPVVLTATQRLLVFVGGMTGGSGGMTCSGVVASYEAR